MNPSTVSKLILILSFSGVLPANAHLRKTKGVNNRKTRDLEEEEPRKGEKAFKVGKEAKVAKKKGAAAVVEVSPMDREETTFAYDEVGEPIYIPDDGLDNEESWNFGDLIGYDREDGHTGLSIGEAEPSDFIIDVGQYNAGEAATANLAEHNAAQAAQAAAAATAPMANATNTTSDYYDPEVEDIEASMMEDILNDPLKEGTYLHTELDTKEDMEQLEEDESDLIVDDGSHLGFTEDTAKLAERLAEAEIQLDTLIQLSDKVVDLQTELEKAMAVIEEQREALDTMASIVMIPTAESITAQPPNHITGLDNQPKSLP